MHALRIIFLTGLLVTITTAIATAEEEPTIRSGKWASAFKLTWEKKEVMRQARIHGEYKLNTPAALGHHFENMVFYFKTHPESITDDGTGWTKEWVDRALAYEYLTYAYSYQKVKPWPKTHPPLDTIADWAVGKGRVDWFGKK